jgi:hypothetical protein
MLWLVFANRHDLAPLLRAQSMQNKAGLRFPAGLLPCLAGIVDLIMTAEVSILLESQSGRGANGAQGKP